MKSGNRLHLSKVKRSFKDQERELQYFMDKDQHILLLNS